MIGCFGNAILDNRHIPLFFQIDNFDSAPTIGRRRNRMPLNTLGNSFLKVDQIQLMASINTAIFVNSECINFTDLFVGDATLVDIAWSAASA